MKEKLSEVSRNNWNNLVESLEILKSKSTRETLRFCLGLETFDWIVDGLSSELVFDHIAFMTLLTENQVEEFLDTRHIEIVGKKVFPSVIIRSRLKYRYRNIFVDDDSLDVKIVKYAISLKNSETRQIELFMPSTDIGEGIKSLENEVIAGNESHYAFKLIARNMESMIKVKNLLLMTCLPDGGGTNEYEKSTTNYFRSIRDQRKRLEVIVMGLHPEYVS